MKSLTLRGSQYILTLALGAALLLAATPGWAQPKLKYSYRDPGGLSKYTQQHVIDVADVPGHQIRVASLHTKYASDAPEYDGIKVVESMASITSDYVSGSGRFTQYAVLQMANGDKVYSRVDGITQTMVATDGTKKSSFTTMSTLTGGTGKFATLRGSLRGTGITDFKTGTSGNVTEGEYWFEK